MRPFDAETVTAILVRILTEEPPPIDLEATGLPAAVGEVLRRAVAKDPAARFASGAEMIATLRAAGGLPARPSAAVATGSWPAAGAARRRGPGARMPPATVVSQPPRRRAAGTSRRVLAVAAARAASSALAAGGSAASRGRGPVAGALVVEEPVGFVGRLLGREPRLLVTVREDTPLRLALRDAAQLRDHRGRRADLGRDDQRRAGRGRRGRAGWQPDERPRLARGLRRTGRRPRRADARVRHARRWPTAAASTCARGP